MRITPDTCEGSFHFISVGWVLKAHKYTFSWCVGDDDDCHNALFFKIPFEPKEFTSNHYGWMASHFHDFSPRAPTYLLMQFITSSPPPPLSASSFRINIAHWVKFLITIIINWIHEMLSVGDWCIACCSEVCFSFNRHLSITWKGNADCASDQSTYIYLRWLISHAIILLYSHSLSIPSNQMRNACKCILPTVCQVLVSR